MIAAKDIDKKIPRSSRLGRLAKRAIRSKQTMYALERYDNAGRRWWMVTPKMVREGK